MIAIIVVIDWLNGEQKGPKPLSMTVILLAIVYNYFNYLVGHLGLIYGNYLDKEIGKQSKVHICGIWLKLGIILIVQV